MLYLRGERSKASDVTIDEIQNFDAFDLLAVCVRMAPRGQLKGLGEDRQRYCVHMDGNHGGAQWGADEHL